MGFCFFIHGISWVFLFTFVLCLVEESKLNFFFLYLLRCTLGFSFSLFIFSYILFCKLNCTLQEDESLRRWKEKLLGCLEEDLNGLSSSLEPIFSTAFPFQNFPMLDSIL